MKTIQNRESRVYLWQEIRRGIPYCRTCEAKTESEAKRKLQSNTVRIVRAIESDA